MNLLIAYATTEGQTDKISQFIGSKLSEAGHEVHYQNVSEFTKGHSVSDFDEVIIAGSVHSAKHQKELELYVFANRERLNEMPGLFVSVSLAAAFPDNQEDAIGYVDTFKQDTGWDPTDYTLVAGAVNPGAYDWFEQSALMEGDLASQINKVLDEEHEFTDWDALANFIAGYMDKKSGRS